LEYLASSFNILDICCGTTSQEKLLSRIITTPIFIIDCPQQPSTDVSCGAYTVKNAAFVAKYLPRLSHPVIITNKGLHLSCLEYTHTQIQLDKGLMFAAITKLIVSYNKIPKCIENVMPIESASKFIDPKTISKRQYKKSIQTLVPKKADLTYIDVKKEIEDFQIDDCGPKIEYKRPKVELSEEEWEASFNDSSIRRKSLFHMSF